jgi:DNA-binding response OmpR family regulator
MKEIYLVHDKQENAAHRKTSLEMSGFSVTLVPSTKNLVKKLQDERPARLILDVLLEGMNGFDLCREVRRTIPAETLPIIMCTSIYRSRIYREEALSAGAQRYLLRPIHPNDLLREASTLIQECQAV